MLHRVHFFHLGLLFFLMFTSCDQSGDRIGLTTGTETLLTARLPGEQFATAMDFVGDLNGDGLMDLLVGAPTNSEAGTDAGMVYVYLSPVTQSSVAVRIIGVAGERLGSAVVALGDVDADGVEDIAIGAPGATPAKIYIFRGGVNGQLNGSITTVLAANAEIILQADSLGIAGSNLDGFGSVLGAAGDLHQDDSGGLLVGVPQAASGNSGSSGIVLYYQFGQSLRFNPASTTNEPRSLSVLASAAELILLNDGVGNLGTALSSVGDVNGDYQGNRRFGDDLLIGAPTDNGGVGYFLAGTPAVSGRLNISQYPAVVKINSSRAVFGRSVAGVGDLDGDGFDEVAIGYSNGVLIMRGFEERGLIDGFQLAIEGQNVSDDFGAAIGGASGYGLTGASGFIVGAPGNSLAGENSGAAYLFTASELSNFLDANPTFIADTRAASIFRALNYAPPSNRFLGKSLRYGGDLNGDGFADALIGLPSFDSPGIDSGGLLLEF